MRWLGCCLLALTVGCANGAGSGFVWDQPPAPARDLPVVDASAIHRLELSNGIQVLVLEDHKLPAVAMGLVFPRGRAIETPEQAGIASFTTELMQRGAGDRDALALAEAVDSLGARMSVGADWDSVSVRIGGLSRDRGFMMSILADVAIRPRFDAAEAERVRTRQLAGLRQAGDDPGTLAGWTFQDVLYGATRAGLPSAGTPAAVDGFDRAAAQAFHRRVVTPEGALLWVTGDVDVETLRAEAEAALGAWEGADLAAPADRLPATGDRRIVVVDWPELGQAQVVLGHEGIARGDDARLPIQLMNTVLGSAGFSSRLMAKVRAEEGLTYGIGSRFAQRRAGGSFSVSTFTEVGQVGKLLGFTLAELERIRSEPPTAEELAWARSLRTGRFALSLESSGAVMDALVDLEVHGLPRDTIDTYRGRIRALTAEEVAEAAHRFIHPERLTIVVVGPADALVPQLEAYGTVEVRTR